ncbi:MAG: 3-isopropylmalate dehydratase small subunit [Gemmatimonadota bacterium]
MSDCFWAEPWAGRALLLPLDDVDTDQIIPARYLKGTARDGLGVHLFADWHHGPDGAPRSDFALADVAPGAARILVAGRNFGCGSSREHAPWALADFGLRAIVARSFADIFRGNALKNGLLPIGLDAEPWTVLVRRLTLEPELELEVDLASQVIRFGSRRAAFPIDPFARQCLLEGVDELGFLLSREPEIAEYERAHLTSGDGG